MSQDTQPAPLGDFTSGLDEFRVSVPAEIRDLLQRLLDGCTLVHISAPQGASLTTTLWAIDATHGRISFSADIDDPQLQRLLDAAEAVVVGYLENIKLQFDLGNLMLVHGKSASALQADMPVEVFRFQRRNSFRVRTPIRSSPSVQMRHPSMPAKMLSLRVIDVSMGGCALFMPDDTPPLPVGVRMQGVRVELDADTRFQASLQVHHVTAINPDSGGVRLGCSLLDTGGDAQRALQRYIDHTQKRRRLLSLD
jgi:c-di-GMP-binding flagellar brake protein YcgR